MKLYIWFCENCGRIRAFRDQLDGVWCSCTYNMVPAGPIRTEMES